MNYVEGQFVVLPQLLDLTKKKIKYTDILTYTALRSFEGDYGCFPSYETIAERANCSRDFVIKSINRLANAKIIIVKRNKIRLVRDRNPVNNYSFTPFSMFERIPYSFFDLDLPLNDRAMLLNLRQFFFGNGGCKINCTLKSIAMELGISYRVMHQRAQSLIDAGYLAKKPPKKRGRPSQKYMLTDKFKWIWDYSKGRLPRHIKFQLIVS